MSHRFIWREGCSWLLWNSDLFLSSRSGCCEQPDRHSGQHLIAQLLVATLRRPRRPLRPVALQRLGVNWQPKACRGQEGASAGRTPILKADENVQSFASSSWRVPSGCRGAAGPAEGQSGCAQLRLLRSASGKSVQTAGGELEPPHEQRLIGARQNRSVQTWSFTYG